MLVPTRERQLAGSGLPRRTGPERCWAAAFLWGLLAAADLSRRLSLSLRFLDCRTSVQHWQLRDLVHCPRVQGELFVPHWSRVLLLRKAGPGLPSQRWAPTPSRPQSARNLGFESALGLAGTERRDAEGSTRGRAAAAGRQGSRGVTSGRHATRADVDRSDPRARLDFSSPSSLERRSFEGRSGPFGGLGDGVRLSSRRPSWGLEPADVSPSPRARPPPPRLFSSPLFTRREDEEEVDAAAEDVDAEWDEDERDWLQRTREEAQRHRQAEIGRRVDWDSFFLPFRTTRADALSSPRNARADSSTPPRNAGLGGLSPSGLSPPRAPRRSTWTQTVVPPEFTPRGFTSSSPLSPASLSSSSDCVVQALSFHPTCIAAGHGVVAAGGEVGQIEVSHVRTGKLLVSGTCSSSVNNAICIVRRGGGSGGPDEEEEEEEEQLWERWGRDADGTDSEASGGEEGARTVLGASSLGGAGIAPGGAFASSPPRPRAAPRLPNSTGERSRSSAFRAPSDVQRPAQAPHGRLHSGGNASPSHPSTRASPVTSAGPAARHGSTRERPEVPDRRSERSRWPRADPPLSGFEALRLLDLADADPSSWGLRDRVAGPGVPAPSAAPLRERRSPPAGPAPVRRPFSSSSSSSLSAPLLDMYVSTNDRSIVVCSLSPSGCEVLEHISLPVAANHAAPEPGRRGEGRLAVAGDDNDAFLFARGADGGHRQLLKMTFGASDVGMGCAWAPAGNAIALVSQDGTVAVWDPRAPKRPALARRMPSAVRCVKWAPSLLDLVAVNEHRGRTHLLDVRAWGRGQMLHAPPGRGGREPDLSGLAFAPGGKRLYVGTEEGVTEYALNTVARRSFAHADFG